MRTFPLINRGLTLPAMVTLVLMAVLAALLVGASAVSAQGSAPDAPDRPVGTAVFIGGVDLEWNEVRGADSYGVQMYRNGQWTDLPGDSIEIAFYGAGAIISELEPEGSSYWFRVRAGSAHGFSEWSDFNFMASTNESRLGRRARPDNVPASGAPVISGTAQVGESLTADTSGIEDGNGLDRVQLRFQWVSPDGGADTDIASATDSTYTLLASDEGNTIKVRVAFTDRGGYAESLTSAATATVAAAASDSPATGALVITGTAEVGETLTADTTGVADADGLSGAIFTYRWIANDGTADTDIQDAMDSTYTLVAADEGRTIKMKVSFTDDAGNGETLTSAATAAVEAAPNTPATGAPAISGTAQVGETLTADTSGIADADGLTKVSYSYRWVANAGNVDTDITDATDSTYTLAAADEGRTVRVKVSFTDDAGNGETLTSAETAAVEAAPNTPATGAPAISGTAQVGETLTASTSGIADADGLTKVSYSYQWIRNDDSTDTDIADATDSTYILAAADEGKTIRVRTSFTDDAGFDETLISAATEAVSFAVQQQVANSPATGAPTISGTVQAGQTLTANTTGIADDDGLVNATYSYQWIRNDSTTDSDIQDATSSTYPLTDDDVGKTIKVRVSFTDDAENEESLTSAATAAVTAPEPPAKPTGLSAAVVSHDAVTLAWDDPLDDSITGYVILRRDREIHPVGTFVTITGDTGSADTTYTDDTVEPDKQYNYKIKAINEYGKVSKKSHWVRADTPAVPVPDQPTGLSTVVSYNTVTLTWDDPQDGTITGYVILRRDREIHPVRTFVTIAGDTGSADTTYTDDTVEPEKQYNYKIKAINEHGEVSEKSDWVRANTPNWATGAPTIGGNAQVGETLTAGISEIADEDGLENTVFSYQWVASNGTTDTNIAAATDSTYDLVAADAGKTIKVRVSFTDDAGNEETLTSTATDIVSFAVQLQTSNSPATGAPVIAGTIQVGETLTADTSSISDADGLTNVSYQYQWIRNEGTSDTEIASATDSTYALADDDEGNTVKVRVSFTDDQDNDESLISPATASVSAQQTPAGPTRLYAGVRAEGVALSWNAPVGTEVEGYRILRKTVGQTEMETLVDNTGSTELSYMDSSDLQHLSTYEYQVVGLTGSTETEASAVFPDNTRDDLVWEDPRAPRRLGASSGEEGMRLRWWPPIHGWGSTPTGWQILRRNITAGETELQVYVDDTGSTSRRYTDPNVEYKNQYVYSVRARNDEGLSLESQSASTTYAHALMEVHPYEPPQNEDSPVEHVYIFPVVGIGYGPDGRTWELEFAVGPLVPDDDPTTKDYIINYRIVDENGDPLPNCEGDGLARIHRRTPMDGVRKAEGG